MERLDCKCPSDVLILNAWYCHCWCLICAGSFVAIELVYHNRCLNFGDLYVWEPYVLNQSYTALQGEFNWFSSVGVFRRCWDCSQGRILSGRGPAPLDSCQTWDGTVSCWQLWCQPLRHLKNHRTSMPASEFNPWHPLKLLIVLLDCIQGMKHKIYSRAGRSNFGTRFCGETKRPFSFIYILPCGPRDHVQLEREYVQFGS